MLPKVHVQKTVVKDGELVNLRGELKDSNRTNTQNFIQQKQEMSAYNNMQTLYVAGQTTVSNEMQKSKPSHVFPKAIEITKPPVTSDSLVGMSSVRKGPSALPTKSSAESKKRQ